MAAIILTFDTPINVSLQPGDRIYAVKADPIGGFYSAGLVGSNDVIFLGICSDASLGFFPGNIPGNPLFNANKLFIEPANEDYTDPNEIPETHSFIMFSKDNRANLGDIRGYYAEVELRNSSKTEAELFGIGMEVSESSK